MAYEKQNQVTFSAFPLFHVLLCLLAPLALTAQTNPMPLELAKRRTRTHTIERRSS
jgi:hypothetical protein